MGKNKDYIVIYKSKTGFTKRYAQWISEELACEAVPFQMRQSIALEDYDTIIFGGGFYAGAVNGVKWLKEKLPLLEGKKVIVFGTGATLPQAAEVQEAFRRNFTDSELSRVKVFYMQSGLCYERMGFGDRAMMAVFRKMLKKTQPDSDMCRAVQKSFDCSSRDAIVPLIQYCREIADTR